MSGSSDTAIPSDRVRIDVWDSHYGPATTAFDRFREAVCTAFMPWTPERGCVPFEGRVQSATIGDATVGRVGVSPIVARKTKRDIARSGAECLYGNYVYSGEVRVDLGGESMVARRGDLLLHHSHAPVTLSLKSDRGGYDNLAFMAPISQFSGRGLDDLSCAVVPAQGLARPLTACFDMMSQALSCARTEDLPALLDASAALIPLSLRSEGRDDGDPRPEGDGLLKEIMRFVDENIAEPDLSAQHAAERFDVSGRYVQMLFAKQGATFRGYVMGERLERVRSEIVSTAGRRAPISDHAFRWGFVDISTFNRAFKRRFGCSPRSYRE